MRIIEEMLDSLHDKLPMIVSLCRENGVERLWLFGSATGRGRRDFGNTSDIDFMIEFDPAAKFPRGLHHPLFTLPERFESLLGRPIHLTEATNFRNPYFRESVETTKELLYDLRSKEAAVGHSAVRNDGA